MAQRNARPCRIVGVLGVALSSILRHESSGVAVVEHKLLRRLKDLLRRGLARNPGRQTAESGIDVYFAEVEASHLLPKLRFVNGLVPCRTALHHRLIRLECSHSPDRIRSRR